MNAPTVTTRKVQRRRQPVRSLDALRSRLVALEGRIPEAQARLLWSSFVRLKDIDLILRNHVWAGDFDGLELRIRRAEGVAR